MRPLPVPVWKPAPFLRLLPLFCAGIIWQQYFPAGSRMICLLAFIFSGLVFAFRLLPAYYQFRLSSWRGIPLLSLVFLSGIMAVFFRDIRNQDNWLGREWKDGDGIVCRLDDPLQEKEKRFRGEASVQYLIRKDSLIKTCGRIYIYFPKHDSVALPDYGSHFIIRGNMRPVAGPANPGDFDFARYASFRNIFHLIYLKSGDWKILRNNSAHPFWVFLNDMRISIINTLQQFIGKGSAEAGVAEALLIGYKQDLDKDLVKVYSDTGVVHIIAISGLHLGLIYWMLQKLFVLIRLHRYKILSGLLQIIFLWTFSLLTGGSASVLRSAVMFSFIIAGTMMGRSASVYNSLAVSAFFLLCYDPLLLWDAGFQLSHLAVLGLVVIQQPLYRSVYLKNKWLDKIWALSAVTLAAQVFTLPACLYYFRQFPVYFLITNLLVVPFSTLILFAGLLLLIISPITGVADFLGIGLKYSIQWMNGFVEWMNDWPGGIIKDLHQDIIGICLLYMFIAFACRLLLFKEKKSFFASLMVCVLMSIHSLINEIQIRSRHQMILYRTQTGTVIDFVNGRNYFSWFSVVTMDSDPSVLQSRYVSQIKNPIGSISMDSISMVRYKNRMIIMIDSLSLPRPLENDGSPQWLILRNNPKISIKILKKFYNPEMLVFDASCKLWKIEKWQKECEKLHLQSHSIPHRGAWVLED